MRNVTSYSDLNLTIPIIEQLYNGQKIFANPDANAQVLLHNQAATKVCNYLAAKQQSSELLQNYYEGLMYFLRDSDLQRILLYLPFTELKTAPDYFRDVYLDAWYRLLSVSDVRENFHAGDVFEPNARKDSKVDLVVKCTHLLPWLLEAGYLSYADIERILKYGQDDTLLLQSFKDTFSILAQNHLVSATQMQKLQNSTSHVPTYIKAAPLYNSQARLEWLKECKQESYKMLTPDANLAGPFSPNLQKFLPELAQIQRKLQPNEIILISGSRLKGYGTANSDFDAFQLQKPTRQSMAEKVNYIFYCITSVWMGGESVSDLSALARRTFFESFDKSLRSPVLRRLESGLLQYRLLQKGFQRFYGIRDFATAQYTSIDGDCAFYDERYRRIATQLFAKYVFLPMSKA